MLIVLSPAKSLDFAKSNRIKKNSKPAFVNDAAILVKELQNLKPADLSSLMGISAKLADLNFERFLKWDLNHSKDSKNALLAFKGDVYLGLDANTLSDKELNFINENVRILSGLYGILNPFDLIREYRLEMGIKFINPRGSNLYEFWDTKITEIINLDIEKSSGDKILVNLASNEYFKSVIKKELKYPVITPVFKDFKNDKYKIISFFAKKARGMMTRYVATNKIDKLEDIKTFNLGGYAYNPELSKDNDWVFTR